MDRYVSRDLQNMVCKELEGIAKKKEIDTPATVELLKGLTGSLKNLMKIDKLEMEKEEPMEMMKGYSQRSMGRYLVLLVGFLSYHRTTFAWYRQKTLYERQNFLLP